MNEDYDTRPINSDYSQLNDASFLTSGRVGTMFIPHPESLYAIRDTDEIKEILDEIKNKK